jgi:hypothetical protein
MPSSLRIKGPRNPAQIHLQPSQRKAPAIAYAIDRHKSAFGGSKEIASIWAIYTFQKEPSNDRER